MDIYKDSNFSDTTNIMATSLNNHQQKFYPKEIMETPDKFFSLLMVTITNLF